MKQLLIIAFTTSCLASTINAATCYFEVDDKIIIEGGCDFEHIGEGSFIIRSERMDPNYFAYVYVDGNSAEAFWNEEKGASHAHTQLGQLRRVGGCWMNKVVRVCAWQ